MSKSPTINKFNSKNFFENIFAHKTLFQFVKYLITGLLAAGLEYLIFFILLNFFEVWYIASNSIGMLAGFIVSFLLNRFWSFQSQNNLYRQLLLYSILFIFNLGLSNGMMYLLSGTLNILPMLAKIIVMIIIVAWNFIAYKKIVYRNL